MQQEFSPSQNSTVEFLVNEINEEIHIDFGATKHFHNGQTLVLKLKQVLRGRERRNKVNIIAKVRHA